MSLPGSVLFAARDIIAPPTPLRAMFTSRSRNSQEPGDAAPNSQELQLLLDWPAPFEVFSENFADRLRGRVIPSQETTSAPDHEFWSDIDLAAPLPRRGLIDSVLAHAALLGLLYSVSIWPSNAVHLAESRSFRSLSGYNLSQYLPELHGKPTRHRQVGKADPVEARQEIRSLPDEPDNLRQTIVAPPKLKLKSDVALPNLVAYGPVPTTPAVEAASLTAKLRLPAMLPEVVAPAVETGSLRSHTKVPSLMPQVVEPAPDVARSQPRLTLPSFQPNVIQPAPEVGSLSRGNTANLARMLPNGSDTVPPAPQIGEAHHASGQLLALSLHPADVHAPVPVPEGNRSGAFAASPTGHANASGAPGADAASGSGGASGSNAKTNGPPGIDIGKPPSAAEAMASPNAPASRLGEPNPSARAKLLTAMRTSPPTIHPPPAHETTGTRSELENRIFAGRRSYTLSVNMPNLNTATGSWIIHFVERQPGAASPIAAPEVVHKSDPAYPGELIKDGVQGTVILTAIIRADGSVTDIAVVKSLDARLDQNAVQALSRWLFRPAVKNGQAIDLEAVITVPFRTKSSSY